MTKTNTDKILIIDCDPGCDDALALLLAIRKGNYKQIIITTVTGNVPVERTTYNAQKIASLALYKLDNKPDIFIHKGAGVSLIGIAPNVMSVHGRDGLGDVPMKLYPQNLRISPVNNFLSAVELLRKIIDEPNGSSYDLVCTGPLTNLAMALSLSKNPRNIINRFDKIVVMGGAFKSRGNITPTAEFNFFFDPIAVKILLDALKNCPQEKVLERVVFVPLDVTEKAQLIWKEIDGKAQSNEIGLWTSCMLQKYFLFHAFGAQILKNNCSTYSCEREKLICCQFEKDDYKKMKDNIKNDRLIGKSGREHLPRFSYLHDPLAVYFAMNYNKDYIESERIAVHTNDDDLRGSLAIIPDKVSLSEKGAYTKGTKVSYLSPDNVLVSYIAQFKEALLDACGLK